MSAWIQSKPLEEITWEDLDSLVTDRVSEGQQIEFKKEIPGKKGNADPWASGGSVADFGRDAICAELSAFLNTYGGVLFLGVDEEREDPRPAKALTPIPRAAELAKRFEDIVRSFDPPTASIGIRAILAPNGTGEGVLVFRVGKSTMAPHGFGSPSAAYVRRAASSMPMSMRELQSTFWEARTLAERILAQRAKFDEQRKKLMLEAGTVSSGHKSWQNPTLNWLDGGLSFRVSAIPQSRLSGLDIKELSEFGFPLRPAGHEFGLTTTGPWRSGIPVSGWILRAHGFVGIEQQRGVKMLFELDESGAISIACFVPGLSSEYRKNVVYVEWFYAPICQCIYLSEILKGRSVSSEVGFEIDVTVSSAGEIWGIGEGRRHLFEETPTIYDHSEIGPFVWRRRDEISKIFADVEKQLFAACGLHVSTPVVPKLQEIIDKKEAGLAILDSR